MLDTHSGSFAPESMPGGLLAANIYSPDAAIAGTGPLLRSGIYGYRA